MREKSYPIHFEELRFNQSFSIDMPSSEVEFVENCDTLRFVAMVFSKIWERLSIAGMKGAPRNLPRSSPHSCGAEDTSDDVVRLQPPKKILADSLSMSQAGSSSLMRLDIAVRSNGL
jgi:hypothetical protein